MKVKKSDNPDAPGYPTRQQLLKCGAFLGAAAIGLAALTSGCMPSTRRGVLFAGAPPIEPRVVSQTNTCVVQEGDTLHGLAKRFLGDEARWQEIVQANPGLAPETLKAGQTISIPNRSATP
jgi:nucleoid-associated protein YgaU